LKNVLKLASIFNCMYTGHGHHTTVRPMGTRGMGIGLVSGVK